MQLQVYKIDGTPSEKTIQVSDDVFGVEENEHAVYMSVQSQRTNMRHGNASTKTRTMVSGGGRKPWKQKGRGAARAGTIRSPLWKGGGIIHGPKPHKYQFKLPKKVKRIARASVLSSKVRSETLKVIEDFKLDQPKTKEIFTILKNFGVDQKRTLILLSDYDQDILRASRNLKKVKVKLATDSSTYDLMECNELFITESGIKKLEGLFTS